MEQDNNKKVTIPPEKTDDEHLHLSNWNLPEKVLEQYYKKGVTRMFEWQYKCLSTTNVLKGGNNLVVSAPTSAGKMLAAEIIAIDCILKKKKVMIIQPYISAVRETKSMLQLLFEKMPEVSVQGFAGSHSPNGRFSKASISIYTIEKAIGPVVDLLKKDHMLGLIIVDELHMIGDKDRGCNLEFLLTNIQYMNRYRSPSCKIQVVGLSATLPNVDVLAEWLDAEVYKTDYRPIPLKEMIRIGDTVFEKTLTGLQEMSASYNNRSEICFEKVSEGHSVIVFCPTKKECENVSKKLAHSIPGTAFEHLDEKRLKIVCDKLKSYGSNAHWDTIIPKGIAYHHADLTLKERAIIENAFRERQLKIIVATTTLSCGVNLPARLVIVSTPKIYGMNALMYKQMVGRAGRKGLDDVGESIITCTQDENIDGRSLILSKPEPVESHLFSETPEECDGLVLLRRGLLELFATANESASEELHYDKYISCTFFHHTKFKATKDGETHCNETTKFEEIVLNSAMKFLKDKNFIEIALPNNEGVPGDRFQATELGLITVNSNLSPEQVQTVYAELEKANKILDSGSSIPRVHVIYLVVLILLPPSKWPKLTKKNGSTYLKILRDQPIKVNTFFDDIGGSKPFLENTKKALADEDDSLKRHQLIRLHQTFFIALMLVLKQKDDQNIGMKTIPAHELLELQNKVIISSHALASFGKLCKFDKIVPEIEEIKSFLTPDADDSDSEESVPQQSRSTQPLIFGDTDEEMSTAKNSKRKEDVVSPIQGSKMNPEVSSSDVKKERKRQRSLDLAEMSSPTKMKMSDEHKIQEQQDKENMEAAPRMRQLISLKSDTAGEVKILDEAVCEWKTVGTYLDFDNSGSILKSIGKSMKPQDAIHEIFRLWRQGKARQYQPATWATLIELLVDSGLKSLADNVRNAVKSNS